MSGSRDDIVVMKFGGTSVGDVPRIQRVAEIVSEFRRANPGTGVVVVVSAMAGETNRLLELAKSCVERPNPRELDVLLASGEQVTVSLLAMRLNEMGHPSKSLLAPQVQIRTNARHTHAQIDVIHCDELRRYLASGGIPVVAGFQGVTDSGDLTTLGRGGSDITAVAVAAALRARTCFIYTDVPGVFSTDPRLCQNAQLLSKVSHEEMLELASMGAKVLHARSVYFAMRYEVPLVVLSTFAGPCEAGVNGTWIVCEGEIMEKAVVTGVTHRVDEAQVTIQCMPSGIEALSRLFDVFAERDIFVDMISQESVGEGLVNVSVTVPGEQSDVAKETIHEILGALSAQGVTIERDIAKVSVVGIGMQYHTGVAARVFKVLAQENIDVRMVNTSEIKMSVLVPRKYCELAVRALHDEFVAPKASN
jgi:aspartate kinase